MKNSYVHHCQACSHFWFSQYGDWDVECSQCRSNNQAVYRHEFTTGQDQPHHVGNIKKDSSTITIRAVHAEIIMEALYYYRTDGLDDERINAIDGAYRIINRAFPLPD